jgi:hypothetical protein
MVGFWLESAVMINQVIILNVLKHLLVVVFDHTFLVFVVRVGLIL